MPIKSSKRLQETRSRTETSSLLMQGELFVCKRHCSAYLVRRSSIVEKVLLGAHEDGRDFSVIIVDSRPMLEGEVSCVLWLYAHDVNMPFKANGYSPYCLPLEFNVHISSYPPSVPSSRRLQWFSWELIRFTQMARFSQGPALL